MQDQKVCGKARQKLPFRETIREVNALTVLLVRGGADFSIVRL